MHPGYLNEQMDKNKTKNVSSLSLYSAWGKQRKQTKLKISMVDKYTR
jgi:hypothetical protein